MGYTHGKQWSDDMIRAAILGVQNTLCINASEFWKGLVE